MLIQELIISPEKNNANSHLKSTGLQLSPIKINDAYLKEWNETLKDFVVLTRDGQLVNNSLYRVGGFGAKLDGKNYFFLLKYVEAHYDIKWLKENNLKCDPKHLDGRWCILDKDGNEKKEFDKFQTPYLIEGSCIYSIGQHYYNIETGEYYCYSSSTMQSSEFLFLNNSFDDDKSMRGVMQINKVTGTFIIHK